MKKHFKIVFFFFALSFGKGSAQANVYHPFPDSAIWRIDEYYYQPFQSNWCYTRSYFHYYILGDTLINSNVYKKTYRSLELVDVIACSYSVSPIGQLPGYVGALRDDSVANKAFFIFPSKSNDSLLYDYNLNVGDTMKGHISESVYGKSNLIVLSVDSILVNGQYRIRWNFANDNNGDSTYFVEGIGSSGGFIEPLNTYPIDFTYRHLVCVKDSISTIFHSSYNSSVGCQLVSSVQNSSDEAFDFKIFPNPSSGIFSLTSSAQIYFIEIADVLGIVIQKSSFKHSESTINLSSSPGGFYFVKVIDGNGNFGVKKIIIQ